MNVPNTLIHKTKVLLEECVTCSGPIALTETQKNQLLETKNLFYCALGHGQLYTGKPARKQIHDLERKLHNQKLYTSNVEEELRQERNSHSATKGSLTKLRKRTNAGVCPHCKRSFKQVSAHIRRKHKGELK